ncbi:GNAT family N-acetyltransferase [Pseudomonas sp. NPDC090233]|uniref:GNAT family N-acetyltransferase n=1 Tax=Pseudomonas sp. NPDC090233 TaxID=3364479 RepID=UPI00383AA7D5
MLIRPTRLNDVPSLAAIERSAAGAFAQLPGMAWLAEGEVLDPTKHRSFIAAGSSWVAESADGHLLGFICASIEEPVMHVQELSVRREVQGQGIGRQLLDQAASEARRLKMHELTLTTFSNVPWNAPFYSRYGFEVIAQCALSPRLRDLLATENDHGLQDRCAMRLLLA